nr:cation:dicarboxylase symporter family transporter [Actinomyces minihominis]
MSSSQPDSTTRRRRLPSFSVQILLGLILGVGLGWLALAIGNSEGDEPNGLTVALSTIGSAIASASSYLGFSVLQILVIAIAVGVAALKVGGKADPFLSFNASLLAIIQKVLWWVIRLAPIGTVGLIGNAIATYGWSSLASLATYSAAVYIGLAIVLFAVYPSILAANRLSIRSYFRGAWPAIQLAFVSRSSIGTLPVTERVASKNLGVPRAYASFAVPLGATTKMDGCSVGAPLRGGELGGGCHPWGVRTVDLREHGAGDRIGVRRGHAHEDFSAGVAERLVVEDVELLGSLEAVRDESGGADGDAAGALAGELRHPVDRGGSEPLPGTKLRLEGDFKGDLADGVHDGVCRRLALRHVRFGRVPPPRWDAMVGEHDAVHVRGRAGLGQAPRVPGDVRGRGLPR